MSMENLSDVLYHGLRDLISAEKMFKTAMPKLAKAASDEELKSCFKMHAEESAQQLERLEQACEKMGKAARALKCDAAEGLVEEGKSAIEEDGNDMARDINLCVAGRKTEYYEITSYEDLHALAKTIGMSEVANLLAETLSEEKAAAEKLKTIASRLMKSAPKEEKPN